MKWILSIGAVLLAQAATVASQAEPTYWSDIRPVLRKNCTVCHSVRTLAEIEVSGGLALDSYESLRQPKKAGLLLTDKKNGGELLRRLLSKDDDKRMPLGAAPLSGEDINLIRRWIDGGLKEGVRPAETDSSAVVGETKARRKRDVVLATTTTPPKDALGAAAPAKLELAWKVGPLAPVTATAFSPDGKWLAVGSYGKVALWRLDKVQAEKVLTNVLGSVNDLRFSPDSKLLAVGGGLASAKGDLRLYGAEDWKLLGVLLGHLDTVSSIAWKPDGKQLASASFDKTVRLWDAQTRKLLQVYSGHSDFVHAVAFGPKGEWLASASKDRTVKLIDAASGKSKFTYSGMDQDVLALAVSPDGKAVVSSGLEPGLYWWNTQSGERLRLQGGHGVAVHEIAFSRDGKLVASAGADRTIRLWNGANGASLRSINVDALMYAVAISPDGKLVAGGGADGILRCWEASSGRLLASLLAVPGEGEKVDWLAMTPEGFSAGSRSATEQGVWRMGKARVTAEAVWRALDQPGLVAKAMRGEAMAPPMFGK